MAEAERDVHHCHPGEVSDIDNPDQQVWCPTVGAWMTRREHLERFADEEYAEEMRAHWGPARDDR